MQGSFKRFSAGLIVVFCIVAFVAWVRPWPVEKAELTFFDWHMNHLSSSVPRDDVVLVLAGERTFKAMKQWPWPRRVHAALLERLSGAKTVALDILFPERSNPFDDGLLAGVVKKMGNVVLSMHLAPDTGSPWGYRAILPYRELLEAGRDLGFVNLASDRDGLLRFAQPVLPVGGQFVPSFSLAAYRLAFDGPPRLSEGPFHIPLLVLKERSLPLMDEARLPIPFSFGKYPVYEYADVLNGKVSPEVFRGKIVFVGASAAGLEGLHAVPHLWSTWMLPGVQIHADLLEAYRYGKAPLRAPVGFDILFAALIMGLGAAGSLFFRPLGTATALGGIGVFCILLPDLLFAKFLIWVSTTIPILALGLSSGFSLFIRVHYADSDLAMKTFSISSLHRLGDFYSASNVSFSDFLKVAFADLKEHHPDIVLMDAVLPLSEALELIKDGSLDENSRNHYLLLKGHSSEDPVFQLLVPLPWENEDYAVSYCRIGWNKRLSDEEIRSLAVLVTSAYWFFKALKASEQKRETLNETVRAMVSALEAKDAYTKGHSERVAELAKKISIEMGLDEREVEEIYLGALIHDLGKIGVPDAIITKKGFLDREEAEVMKTHPSIGRKIMESVKLPTLTMQAIAEHHERLNGRGYPRRAIGESIGIAGRIVAVADVYDALTSDRPYRAALTREKALGYLCERTGTFFDASVVEALVRLATASGEVKKEDLKEGWPNGIYKGQL